MKRFVVLIAVIGLLSTFLFFGCVDTREEHKQLLMDSLEKQLAIPDEYQINSIETVQGIALDITIAKSSNEKVLITESELDTKWVFLKDDLNFICEQKKAWMETSCVQKQQMIRDFLEKYQAQKVDLLVQK